MLSRLQSVLSWLRALGSNPYFWGGLGGLFVVGLGLYFLLDAIVMPSYTRHDAEIRVPNLENQPFEEASTRVRDLGLRVERQEGRFNPNVDQNVVVDQTPLPRSAVKPDRRVYLTVNAGEAPTVQLPDLSGMSVREAKNRLSSLGLAVDSVRKDSIPSPYANTITKQNPAAGDSLQKGESVELWYSTGLGEAEVEVPQVLGERLETAKNVLLRKKLRAVVVDTTLSDDVPSDDAPSAQDPVAGDDEDAPPLYVRRQGRSPGSTVRTGTEIRLFTTTDSVEAAELRERAPDTTGAAANVPPKGGE